MFSGLRISMDYPVCMCKCDRFASSTEESQAVIKRDAGVNIFIKAFTSDVLHHVIDTSIRKCTQIMNRHYPGMLEPGDDMRLAPHPFDHHRRHFRRIEHFDRHIAVKPGISSKIDDPHSATCDLVDQLVSGLRKVRAIGDLEQSPDLLIR